MLSKFLHKFVIGEQTSLCSTNINWDKILSTVWYKNWTPFAEVAKTAVLSFQVAEKADEKFWRRSSQLLNVTCKITNLAIEGLNKKRLTELY